MSESHVSHDPEQTHALALQLAQRLNQGDVVALTGDLGSGKTVFARGLIMAMGHNSHISSPTYTIQQTYRTASHIIHHLDLYRLASEEDVDMLDLEECWQDNAITIIEWADRANTLQFPRNTWHVSIRTAISEQERIIEICPPGHSE